MIAARYLPATMLLRPGCDGLIAQIAVTNPLKPRGEHYEQCIGAKKHLVSIFG
jgi:hypothetical protein